jgi:hypothetical protein
VDSFNLSDFFIRSPLGRYDGTFWQSHLMYCVGYRTEILIF